MIAWNMLSWGPQCGAVRCDGCVGFLGPLSRRIPLRACLLRAGFCLLSVHRCWRNTSGPRFAVGRPLHTDHLPDAWLSVVGRCDIARTDVGGVPACLTEPPRLVWCDVLSCFLLCWLHW